MKINLPELVNTFNEHDKCRLCFAYFCKHYIRYENKEATCYNCKHKKECMFNEFKELENFEPIVY